MSVPKDKCVAPAWNDYTNTRRSRSEVGVYRELELVDEDLFEWRDIVLLIKEQHRLFILHRINGPERYRAVFMLQQDGVAHNAGRPFVPVHKGLYVGYEHKGEQCFLKNVVCFVDECTHVSERLSDLERVVEWAVVRSVAFPENRTV